MPMTQLFACTANQLILAMVFPPWMQLSRNSRCQPGQLAISHSLDKVDIDLNVNNNHIDCIDKTKLLGTLIDHYLKWDEYVKHLSASCYPTLATLRNLKNILPFNIHKIIVQSVVLSISYFIMIVYFIQFL